MRAQHRGRYVMGNARFPIRFRHYKPLYKTKYGRAFVADSIDFVKSLPNESIDLIVTSPPFALIKKKKYGNKNSSSYVSWFVDNFAEQFFRILKPTGSLVIDIGGAWNRGKPTRSLYHFELVISLCSKGFHLAQEFYWYNSAKLPSPAQWVNIERIRVKDAVNPVWWLSKSDRPKADNRRILTPYKPSMLKLFENGYNDGPRPSGHNISTKWNKNNGGAIPGNLLGYDNLLEIANTNSNDKYLRACKKLGVTPHPARFPLQLPDFFIRFLTEENDVVYDPFGGSGVTGEAAENNKRFWITSEINPEYVKMSRYRFINE